MLIKDMQKELKPRYTIIKGSAYDNIIIDQGFSVNEKIVEKCSALEKGVFGLDSMSWSKEVPTLFKSWHITLA